MVKINFKKLEQEAEIANNYFKSGDFKTAEIKIKKVIKSFPGYIAAYNLLGVCLSAQEKIKEAIECYKDAIKKKPDFALGYNNLAIIYENLGKKDEAEKYFRKSIEVQPKLAIAHNNLGNFLRNHRNKYYDAIKYYKQALIYEPEMFAVHHNLGLAYQNIGKFTEALDCFKTVLKLNPKFFAVHRSIAVSTKYEKDSKHIIEMENFYADKIVSNKQKVHIAFALGKAYEDIKEYKKAFEKFSSGNNFKREDYEYSTKNEASFFKSIRDTFNKESIDKFKNLGNKSKRPIFILGMPRSGTTLVEQILSSHPDVYGAGELIELSVLVKEYFNKNNQISFPENLSKINKSIFIEMGNKYIYSVEKIADGSKFITDKAPLNFKWIGIIKLIFPNAKIIHLVRDARSTCISVYKNYFAGKFEFAYNLDELGHYHNMYRELMEYWHKILPNFIHDVSYENLISNQEKETRKLLEFCNLEWNENCLQFHKNKRPISTVSFSQARNPIYKSSLNSWQIYENEIKPMLKILKN